MSTKLTNLTAADGIDGTESLYVVKSGNSRKTTTSVLLDQDNMTDGTTNKNFTATEKTKLAGIETGADVTDATNVNAAGAVMNTDTSVADMQFVNSAGPLADSATTLASESVVKDAIDALGVPSIGAGERGQVLIVNDNENSHVHGTLTLAAVSRSFRQPPNPFWQQTALQLHFVQINSGEGFYDSSPRAKRGGSLQGNANVSSNNELALDGTGDWLQMPDHADYDLADNDFQIDVRVNFAAIASGDNYLVTKYNSTDNREWQLSYHSTGGVRFYWSTDGTGTTLQHIDFGGSISTGAYQRVTVSRKNGVARAFIDGVQVGTDEVFADTIYSGTAVLAVGSNATGGAPVNGAIKEVRIINGGAINTEDFTDYPFVPFPDYGGTLNEGDRYIVCADAVGEWAGNDGQIALVRADGSFVYDDPRKGALAYVDDEKCHVAYSGTRWEKTSQGENHLYNSCFTFRHINNLPFNSTSVPATKNGNYLFQRWVLISDGDDIVSFEDNATTGRTFDTPNPARFTVEVANKKFGFAQILPWFDARKLHNKFVSISAGMRSITGQEIAKVYMALIRSRNQTKDLAPKDPVFSWQAAGTLPSLKQYWEYVAVKEFDVVAQSAYHPTNGQPDIFPESLKIEAINLLEEPEGGDSGNNYAVMFWVDEPTTVGDVIDAAWVKLEVGASATPYVPRPSAVESKELDYFRRLFGRGVQGWALNTTTMRVSVSSESILRDAPTVSLIETPTFNGAGASVTPSSPAISNLQTSSGGGTWFDLSGFTGLTQYAPYIAISGAYWLLLDAEIGNSA